MVTPDLVANSLLALIETNKDKQPITLTHTYHQLGAPSLIIGL